MVMSMIDDAVDACTFVFVPEADISNILCDYQFVFSALDELCFTLCLMQQVMF